MKQQKTVLIHVSRRLAGLLVWCGLARFSPVGKKRIKGAS
jgi:hypothetical protein